MSAARQGERGVALEPGQRVSAGSDTHRETQLEGELAGSVDTVDEACLDAGRAGHLLAVLLLPTQVHSYPNVTIRFDGVCLRRS